MWSSFAVAALSLAPAQPATGLQLVNVRLTIGELGSPRPSARLLPGDVLFIGFDITGLPIGADGMAEYEMAMEVSDAANKTIFKQDPRKIVDFVPLRGNTIPARAFITIGLDQGAGAYTGKVTVTDPKTKASNNLTVKFEVLKRDFGIVAVIPFHDERGEFQAPNTGVVGQMIFVHYSIATFQRDPKSKQPNVEITFEVRDEKNQPTLGQPRKHVQDSGVDEKAEAFQMRFPLFMSRPGKFTVKIAATDRVANKTSTYELPVTVLPAN